LKKNLISNPDPNKPEIERMKLINVMFLGEGSMVGLESVSESKKQYQFSVFCESEYAIFFKVPLDKLFEMGESTISFLDNEYKNFKEKVSKTLENYTEYKKDYKIYYHEHHLEKGIRKHKYRADDERRINKKIHETINEIKKTQFGHFRNDFSSYNLIKKSISNRELKPKEHKVDLKATLRNPYAEKLKLKLFELTKVDEGCHTERVQSDEFKKILGGLSLTKRNKETINDSHERTSTSFGMKRVQTEPDSRFNDYTVSHEVLQTSRSHFRNNAGMIKPADRLKTESQDSKYIPHHTVSDMKSTLNPFSQVKKVKIKLVLNERLVNNIKNWQKLQSKQYVDNFNTGCFNMPLISNNCKK
jgi:hypothetical protein